MIVRISSAIVPHAMFDSYLSHVQTSTIPAYEAAAGLISVSVFQRLVVGYVEPVDAHDVAIGAGVD